MKYVNTCLVFILIVLWIGTGCLSQKEDQPIITVVDSLFVALQQKNNKQHILKLSEKNSPAEKIFSEETLYIGTLINKKIKLLNMDNNNALVQVSFQYNDGFHSLDQGNHDSNDVIMLTLVKKNNEWKIWNIEKE